MEKSKKVYSLRTKKRRDYAEMSNGRKSKTPRKSNQKPLQKIPLYKQPLNNSKPVSNIDDLYEFDSDSEAVKKKRVRKKTIKTERNIKHNNNKNTKSNKEKVVKDNIKNKVRLPVPILEKLNKDIITEKLLSQNVKGYSNKTNDVKSKVQILSNNKTRNSVKAAKEIADNDNNFKTQVKRNSRSKNNNILQIIEKEYVTDSVNHDILNENINKDRENRSVRRRDSKKENSAEIIKGKENIIPTVKKNLNFINVRSRKKKTSPETVNKKEIIIPLINYNFTPENIKNFNKNKRITRSGSKKEISDEIKETEISIPITNENFQTDNIDNISSPRTPDDNFRSFNINNNIENEITNNEHIKNRMQSHINILSNIILSPIGNSENDNDLIDTPTSFKRPNANSTMLNGSVFKPWRFNEINIKHNPHFLKVKQSALPNINQDIILDYTFDESVIKTPKQNNENKKQAKQRSLLNYIKTTNHSIMNNEKENINSSSLFDENDFSPIKLNSQNSNTNNKTESVKRNILTLKMDNSINKNVTTRSNSTPLFDNEKINSNQNKSDTESFFGFDSMIEDGEDIINNENKDKPFRISEDFVRKYQNKRKRPEIKVDELSESENEESSDNESLSDNNETLKEVGLFVDLDNNNEVKTLPRKKKIRWLNNEKKSKKKIKDCMTKEEEMALNKWAQNFNSICEEIDKHNLEIE